MVIDYINSSKALAIISGILISVVVAFITGAVVQYIARLVFTFHFEHAYRRIGGIYGSFAITSIMYFLIFKGAKGASFMRPEWLAFLKENTWSILATLFVVFAIAFQLMIVYFKTNIFKIVILAGTFSLAFAFAGNDLVNFVGVPLAAYDSWREWSTSGVAAEIFTMGGLLKPIATPTVFLLLSGLVMVLTLWFSKKAHRVIQTSINLSSSQSGEHEQFGSSLPARLIVRASLNMGNIINQILPNSLQNGLNKRFKPKETAEGEETLPFDYVRASINLMVSAILIASATSLKLPLSTTYVTFMVAMGSSFADGAWDRETAVYRISGVLAVISGWFMTAFSACFLAGIICAIVLFGGPFIAVVLALVAIGLIIKSNLKKDPDLLPLSKIGKGRYDAAAIHQLVREKCPETLQTTLQTFSAIIDGFLNDSEKDLRKALSQSNKLHDCLHRDRGLYYTMANSYTKPSKSDNDSHYCYYRIFTSMHEVSRSLQRLATLTKDHVANRHRIYDGNLRKELLALQEMLQTSSNTEEALNTLHSQSAAMRAHIESLLAHFLESIPEEGLSMRGCEVYLNCIIFIRELLSYYEVVYALKARVRTLAQQIQPEDSEHPASASRLHDTPSGYIHAHASAE